jgi:hypothetical protein
MKTLQLVRTTPTLAEVIDPFDYAVHEVRKARTELAARVFAVRDVTDALQVWDELRALRDEFDALASLAGAKVDAISTRS